jgi:hypothetical protein
LFSPEGCVAFTRTADRPIEATRGVVLGNCRNGRIDGYALILLQLRTDRALLPAKFDNGARSAELAPLTVRLDGRASFQVRSTQAKPGLSFEYPNPEVGFEQWRRHLRELPDAAWRENIRVPQFWSQLVNQLERHGRGLVPGEAAPGAEAQKVSAESWPKGWAPLEKIPGWVWVDAGSCIVAVFEPNHRNNLGARHGWDGSCAQGFASGPGIYRRYAGNRLDFIVRAEFRHGIMNALESYFRASPSAPIMGRTPGTTSAVEVAPLQVPAWAQEITK